MRFNSKDEDMSPNNGKLSTWEKVVAGAKTVTVICAFLAFALSMRQKEYDRFSVIKPLFEIQKSFDASKLTLINHGGLVYFVGCEDKSAGAMISKTPRKYSSLSNKPVEFVFAKKIEEKQSFICHYRDIDQNTYILKIIAENDGFYIDGAPDVFRSDLFVTVSGHFLDSIVSFFFPKDWYSKGEAPKDDGLKVAIPEN